jgi:glycosyltransferase involved in cell wall biosynthesis
MLRAGLRRLRRRTVLRLREAGVLAPANPPVMFVSDGADWALDRLGDGVCASVNRISPGSAERVRGSDHLVKAVVHFASRNLWTAYGSRLSHTNRSVATVLHGRREDGPQIAGEIDAFLDTLPRLNRVVTSCTLLRDRLQALGVPGGKLAVIPLGADTRLFTPGTAAERTEARMRLGIPEGMFAVGSFQKDGCGWGEGMEPKPVKGPDIFVDTLGRLARHFPVIALLTGPARGYVRAELDRRGVPWRHVMVERFEDIVDCYRALDLYLVASRDEGGPLALPEGMACGVPVVSTPVGMAPDIIRHGVDGMLASSVDARELADLAGLVLSDAALRSRLATNGPGRAAAYDWDVLGQRHYDEVYRPLLAEIGR